MGAFSDKTFVIEFKRTADNLAINSKTEIQANSVDVRGDFVLFLDQQGKGIAAFAGSTVIKVTVKADA